MLVHNGSISNWILQWGSVTGFLSKFRLGEPELTHVMPASVQFLLVHLKLTPVDTQNLEEAGSDLVVSVFRLRIRSLKGSSSRHWSGSSGAVRMLGSGKMVQSRPQPLWKKAAPQAHPLLCVCVCVCRLTGQVADEPVTDVSEILLLESSHPRMSFMCRFQRAVVTVMSRIFLISVGEIKPP